MPGIACGGPIQSTDTDGRFAMALAMMASATPSPPLLWRDVCALKQKFFWEALVVSATSRLCVSRLIPIPWRKSSKPT